MTDELGSISPDFFSGAAGITSGELRNFLNQIANQSRPEHVPIASASRASFAPGKGPTPYIHNVAYGLEFTAVDDVLYRMFKIPRSYVEGGPASFHVHWTKSGDVDESGNQVTWRLSYTQSSGGGGSISQAPTVIDLVDTYDDASTDSSRIMYRTSNFDLSGLVPGYYLNLKIERLVAGTNLTSNAVLISVDSILEQYVWKT